MTGSLGPAEAARVKRGFSRRNFGRLATLLTAGATLPFYNEPALAQSSTFREPLPADAVKIDANENPMGRAPRPPKRSTTSSRTADVTCSSNRSCWPGFWPGRRA